jgi:hypothetical protein
MRIRLTTCLLLAGAVLGQADLARAQQTVNFSLGYFTLRGEDARVEGDVLNGNRDFLTFDIGDFNGASVGGEWLIPFGDYLEGGIGISFSRKTVASVYTEFVDDDGTEIEQDLRLRLVPIAFTVRFTPLGRTSAVQPYIGAGLGIINWRYSESGEFVDFNQGGVIFREQFVADGSATGPVVVGGVRFVGDAMSVGGELRYHAADVTDDGFDEWYVGFPEPRRLDIGGWTYNFTIGLRF